LYGKTDFTKAYEVYLAFGLNFILRLLRINKMLYFGVVCLGLGFEKLHVNLWIMESGPFTFSPFLRGPGVGVIDYQERLKAWLLCSS
jgi:hypothetical protein